MTGDPTAQPPAASSAPYPQCGKETWEMGRQFKFALRARGQEATCLCIRFKESLELDFWQGLGIGDETLEVTEEGEE